MSRKPQITVNIDRELLKRTIRKWRGGEVILVPYTIISVRARRGREEVASPSSVNSSIETEKVDLWDLPLIFRPDVPEMAREEGAGELERLRPKLIPPKEVDLEALASAVELAFSLEVKRRGGRRMAEMLSSALRPFMPDLYSLLSDSTSFELRMYRSILSSMIGLRGDEREIRFERKEIVHLPYLLTEENRSFISLVTGKPDGALKVLDEKYGILG